MFSAQLRSQFGYKVLLKVLVQWYIAFKGSFDIEQWMQCFFIHVNYNRVEKLFGYNCSVSVCQIIQHQNMNRSSVDT